MKGRMSLMSGVGESTRRKTVSGAPLTRPRDSEQQERGVSSNMRVYVRCRSRNEQEIEEKSSVVISTLGAKGREVILSNGAGPLSHSKRTYTFDQVFGAESDQETVFDEVAKDYISEMLEGYNCTVFTYGQTGTGKTYTMSGDISILGDLDSQDKILLGEHSGIIPRVLVDLFKQLSQETNEYTVKVSFLELYNEKLKDLLAESEQEEETIRIFDNNSGYNGNKNVKHLVKLDGSSHRTSSASSSSSSIMVKGMEEFYIKSAHEGLQLLMTGSSKRKVAATKCNDLSSRSHTVFTITTNVARTDPVSSEQYIKIGKLNLVDLAGSENINRSGAENKRAQEAGLINKSLLTLGRVINALVDNSQHIPYRESKLTRLLQDSLGGKTKTCIIATISPAKISMDETVSTLEYATRAKSIKNTPQVNQSMSKNSCLGEYIHEIERLRQELKASRQKEGMYITEDQFRLYESNSILVEEQKVRIQNMEDQILKFKGKYVEQTNISKEAEKRLKQSQTLCKKLSIDKAEMSQNFQSFRQTCNEYVDEVKNVHRSNIELIQSLQEERDSLFGKSVESVNMISSLIADNIRQGKNLSKLNSSLQAYSSKYDRVSAGVFEEMESNVIVHKNAIVGQLNSISLDAVVTDIQSMHRALIKVLSDLQKYRFDDKGDIHSAHRYILNQCYRRVCHFLTKLDTSFSGLVSGLRQASDISLGEMDKLGESYSGRACEVIETQKRLIEDMTNKLFQKSQALEKSNTHILSLQEYLKEYTMKQRSKIFDDLKKAVEIAEGRQSSLEEDVLKKSIDTLQTVKNEMCTEHLTGLHEMAELGTSSLNSFSELMKKLRKKLSQLSHESTDRLSHLLATNSITKELHDFKEAIVLDCSDHRSQSLVQKIDELNTKISSNVEAVVLESSNAISESSDKVSAASIQAKQQLENAVSELDALCGFLLTTYKENVNQITKTQDCIISNHCADVQLSIATLETPAQHLDVPTQPQIKVEVPNSLDGELPKLRSPGKLVIQENYQSGTDNENLCSPERNHLVFNPSTPVPVPDQPLSKVLLSRSINSNAKRSTMLPVDLKKPQIAFNNNLKRRFTTEPVIERDDVHEKMPRSGGT